MKLFSFNYVLTNVKFFSITVLNMVHAPFVKMTLNRLKCLFTAKNMSFGTILLGSVSSEAK